MKYLITTLSNATSISETKALAEGCGPVTKYWWAVITNPDDATEAAVCYSDDDALPEGTVDALPASWTPYLPE